MNNKTFDWQGLEVDWNQNSGSLMELFNTTWPGHPITTINYFNWHLVKNCYGPAVAYCASPDNKKIPVSGVYLVLPNILLVAEEQLKFSVSLYTLTHPDYYRKGIFKGLANLTYNKCADAGIVGTVGVPNNNSLPGFSRSLGFDVIGQLDIMGRVASPFCFSNKKFKIKKILHKNDIESMDLGFIHRKAKSGVILFERNIEFIIWRFLKCPSVKYHIYGLLDADSNTLGLIVMRNIFKKGVPIVVILDFLVDNSCKEPQAVSEELLSIAHRQAFKAFSPFVITLSNTQSTEAKYLKDGGFRLISKKILPHECNFILKFHGNQSEELTKKIGNFENWYFSFADYDIY